MSNKVKAIGFVRIANRLETIKESNLKLEQQKKLIVDAATKLNVEIVQWFELCGTTYIFSELQKAIGYCKENSSIKYLVVTEPSRISRSLGQFLSWEAQFEQIGVTIKNIASLENLSGKDPLESFMDNLVLAVGRLERQHRSEAAKAGLHRKKQLEKSMEE